MYRVQLLIEICNRPEIGPNPCSLKPDLATAFVWQQHLHMYRHGFICVLGETQPRDLDTACHLQIKLSPCRLRYSQDAVHWESEQLLAFAPGEHQAILAELQTQHGLR